MRPAVCETVDIGPKHVIEIRAVSFDEKYDEQVAVGVLREFDDDRNEVSWEARRSHPAVYWEVELLPSDDSEALQADTLIVPTDDGGCEEVALDEADGAVPLSAWFHLLAEADWQRHRALLFVVGKSGPLFRKRIASMLDQCAPWPDELAR